VTTQSNLYESMADRLLAYDPADAHALILEILVKWGGQLCEVGVTESARMPAADLWRILQTPQYAFTDDNPPEAVRTSLLHLHRQELEEQAMAWVRMLMEHPYDEAIHAFVDAVYTWLHQADLSAFKPKDVPPREVRSWLYYIWGAQAGVD
jgi:hypothetical protein